MSLRSSITETQTGVDTGSNRERFDFVAPDPLGMACHLLAGMAGASKGKDQGIKRKEGMGIDSIACSFRVDLWLILMPRAKGSLAELVRRIE